MQQESSKISKLAEKSQQKNWTARNMLMLEAVISAFMDTHNAQETAQILREQADILEQYL